MPPLPTTQPRAADPVGLDADVSVELHAGTDADTASSVLVTVANAGPAAATAVTVTITSSNGVIVTLDTPAGWTCSEAGSWRCSLERLDPATRTTLRVRLDPSPVDGITVEAVVSTATDDLVPSNDRRSISLS